jgi:hypothetical protein
VLVLGMTGNGCVVTMVVGAVTKHFILQSLFQSAQNLYEKTENDPESDPDPNFLLMDRSGEAQKHADPAPASDPDPQYTAAVSGAPEPLKTGLEKTRVF